MYFSGLVSTRLANARTVSTELVSLLCVEFGVANGRKEVATGRKFGVASLRHWAGKTFLQRLNS